MKQWIAILLAVAMLLSMAGYAEYAETGEEFFIELEDAENPADEVKLELGGMDEIEEIPLSEQIEALDGLVLSGDISMEGMDHSSDAASGNGQSADGGVTIGGEYFTESLEQCLSGKKSTEYYTDLSYMLMALANAAYDERSICEAYSNLGFADYKPYNYYEDPNDSRYGADNVAFIIGTKNVQGEPPTVLVTIRGSYGEIGGWTSDWRSNSKISTDSKSRHLGFSRAANKVYKRLMAFLSDKGLNKSEVTYVITGHSRGAAVANLLAVRLHDDGIANAKVFDYNFACPDTARGLKIKNWEKGHKNIFNICNSADAVSVIPGVIGDTVASGLGYDGLDCIKAKFQNLFTAWGKYGKTMFFCRDWDDADEFDLLRTFSDPSPHDPTNYVAYMRQGKDRFYTWSDIVKRRIELYVDAGVQKIVELLYPDYGVATIELSKKNSNGTVYLYNGDEAKLIPSFAKKIAYSSSRGSAAGRRKKQQIKSYTSSNESVASVSKTGLITAKTAGETTITATTNGGHKATVTVKVVLPPTKIKLNKSGTVKLKAGKTLRLKATLTPSDAYTTITWKSSNKKVAKVSGKGVVSAVGPGTATISATTHNGKKASCKVKVTGTSVKVGDSITFGHYDQDNDLSNGKEPIEWLVLQKSGNDVMMISRYGLDAKPYNEENTSVTWETCTLRAWLNGEFLNQAFTASEQSRLKQVTVTAEDNLEYGTDAGNDTQDRVYLLSISEAENLFDSDEARKCWPTQTAVANGAYTDNSGCCTWWLRSPGRVASTAAFVRNDGFIFNFGNVLVSIGDEAVRPVVVLRLS